MAQRPGSSSDRTRGGTEVALATDPPATQTTVVDLITTSRPGHLDRSGTETRRTVVDGVPFVHHRFRDVLPAGPPAALLQHYPMETGTWDPSAPPRRTDGRELILVEHLDPTSEADTGEPELDRLARESLDFVDALGLAEVDLLGFSFGVRPADDIVLLSPRLVARLVAASDRARSLPTPIRDAVRASVRSGRGSEPPDIT